MIAFHMRTPSQKSHKPSLRKQSSNFSRIPPPQWKSSLCSYKASFGRTTAATFWQPLSIWIPSKQYCAPQMLNGPQKKHFMLHISRAASVPDVLSCGKSLHIADFISSFVGLQGWVPGAGGEGQRAGSREGSHRGSRPGRGLSGCDGHHEGWRHLCVFIMRGKKRL